MKKRDKKEEEAKVEEEDKTKKQGRFDLENQLVQRVAPVAPGKFSDN